MLGCWELPNMANCRRLTVKNNGMKNCNSELKERSHHENERKRRTEMDRDRIGRINRGQHKETQNKISKKLRSTLAARRTNRSQQKKISKRLRCTLATRRNFLILHDLLSWTCCISLACLVLSRDFLPVFYLA